MAEQNCRHLLAPSINMPHPESQALLRALPSWWGPLLDAALSLRRRRCPLLRFAGAGLLRVVCFVAAGYARAIEGRRS